ncbi:hypothetical protein M427DRAFT_35808 [Gonapodya prolifera JEL478]|uniref:Uncharacterized protein n=1 Tax=Gonapodya prolifera (strain JEL478) TaxID=1344416 RepID=A0A139A431_GONPJ|nr:hypothetical protein M427DRAFT_35808 [Gonapodya prolifera JEL478]|eukprot:KXS11429.1 hypothetical protein M427DRAFT_35808 [Gonapodya prolifera JEL478]
MSDAFYADPTDVVSNLAVNSIVLASFVSQFVVLLSFVPDMSVLPVGLKGLYLISLVNSMIAPLLVFISNNFACHPAVPAGFHFYWLGLLWKWMTHFLRIWALSKKNKLVAPSMVV